MPSADQACVPVPVPTDRASRARGRSRCHAARSVTSGGTGRSISALASPAPVLARALQKYDKRTVHCGAPRRRCDEQSQARASRLTAYDHRRPEMLLLGRLTPMFAQNNSEIDGLGCHQVNFASAVFYLNICRSVRGRVRVNRGVAPR